MKSGLTYIIFVIDRSGSMASIKKDMIGGFNAFIKAQKASKAGDCRVFAYQFDTSYDTIFENADVQTVADLTDETYQPRGGTALYDSLGLTIDNIGTRLSALPENQRPEKVLVVTITDGEDNSRLTGGKAYSSEKVKEMVKHQTNNYNWQFAYIGANQDAWAVGGSMGVANNLNYVADSAGTAYAFDNLARSATMYRASSLGNSAKFKFAPDTQDADDKTPANP